MQFVPRCPLEHHGRCHTMRGRDITDIHLPGATCSSRTTPAADSARTIGIGDGGNEIGMGKVPWDVIRRNIPGGGLVACRVPTDHLIVGGISNWGAYGLAAGVRLLRGTTDAIRTCSTWSASASCLRVMVEQGPLVDGVTGEPAVTVDGLTFERYGVALSALAGSCKAAELDGGPELTG